MHGQMHAPIPPDVERLGKMALDAAFRVHTELGPGLLEAVYEACCAHELRQEGVAIETQVLLPVTYHTVRVDAGLRLDMVLDKKVIVEFKAVEATTPLHAAQLLTYLKLTGIRLGYLMNFNVVRMKDGIKRLVL